MADALTDPQAVAAALGGAPGQQPSPEQLALAQYLNSGNQIQGQQRDASKALLGTMIPQSMKGPSDEDVNRYNQVMTGVQQGKYKPGKLPTPDIGQNPNTGVENFTKGALEAVGTFGVPAGEGAIASKVIPAIFAGIGAKTADRVALKMAQRMAESGEAPTAIHALTGWFQHPVDKRWRFEIPDLGLQTRPGAGTGISDPNSPVTHLELAKAYPQLDKMLSTKIDETPQDVGGFYHWGNPERMKIEAGGPTDAVRNAVAGHELQHAVQRIEGFAPGSHLDMHWGLLNDPALMHKMPDLDYNTAERAAIESYLRGSGETEARNVENRLDMNKVQRRMNPPWTTQDRPYSVQTAVPNTSSMESIIHFLHNPSMMKDVTNIPRAGDLPEGLAAQGGSSWRLNDAQKHNIADRYKSGEPVASIASEYGIHPNMVYRHAMARGAEPRMEREVRNQFTGPAPEPPPDTRAPWNRPKLKEDYSRETLHNTLLTVMKLLNK